MLRLLCDVDLMFDFLERIPATHFFREQPVGEPLGFVIIEIFLTPIQLLITLSLENLSQFVLYAVGAWINPAW